MRVSFDFDDTLLQTLPDEDAFLIEGGPNEAMLAILRVHAAAGDEVLIVTSRTTDMSSPTRSSVSAFVQAHALPVVAVHFTAGQPKVATLISLGVEKHFDDDPEELAALPDHIQGVLVPLHPAWGSTPIPEA